MASRASSLAWGIVPLSAVHAARRWRGREAASIPRSVALLALSASALGSFSAAAAEESDRIAVPMRRDAAAAVRPRPERAAPEVAADAIVQATEMIRRELGILRDELGGTDAGGEAEPHDDRAPIHVYVKSLEVMSKLGALQVRLGMAKSEIRDMPLAAPTSDDLVAAVTDILAGIESIKSQMVIDTEADAEPVSGPRSLSVAYQNLADASAMLDGLTGRSLTTRDVLRGSLTVIEELRLVADSLNVDVGTERPEVVGRKGLPEVAQQTLRATYKAIILQRDLGMDPSTVPNLTMVRLTPTELYDLTGILHAEVARIKWHLGVDLPTPDIPAPPQGDATEVFANVLVIVRGLDNLVAAARGRS